MNILPSHTWDARTHNRAALILKKSKRHLGGKGRSLKSWYADSGWPTSRGPIYFKGKRRSLKSQAERFLSLMSFSLMLGSALAMADFCSGPAYSANVLSACGWCGRVIVAAGELMGTTDRGLPLKGSYNHKWNRGQTFWDGKPSLVLAHDRSGGGHLTSSFVWPKSSMYQSRVLGSVTWCVDGLICGRVSGERKRSRDERSAHWHRATETSSTQKSPAHCH